MQAGVSFDAQDDEIKEAVKNHPAFTKLGEREFTTVLMTFWRVWELEKKHRERAMRQDIGTLGEYLNERGFGLSSTLDEMAAAAKENPNFAMRDDRTLWGLVSGVWTQWQRERIRSLRSLKT